MPGISNCKRCGKMYGYTGKPICPNCFIKEEEDFETARAYVKENPGAGMKDVSDETGVPIKLLTKFVREGRIDLADGSKFMAACTDCGKTISTGRLCNECMAKLGREMMDAVPSQKPKSVETEKKAKERMHISKFRN